ncbi:MAG: GNAT family N-acetyltransferase [Pseudomonadaceae bacterium]|nr:GNAT family N-acetyltransferase [Pseudomonadaceae bacterium]
MPTVVYQWLDEALVPLANKFYKSQRSSMRAGRGEQIWVAKETDIIAACCLKPQEHGHWLTALLVAEPLRQQGIASALLHNLRGNISGPIWLFCQPNLVDFYQRQGFQAANQLPQALTQRLQRYQQKQPLQALISNPLAD